MSPAVRIDVHQHIVPPFWAEALPDHGGDPSGWVSPEWSAESTIEFMDSQNIAMEILSLRAEPLPALAKLIRQFADLVGMVREVAQLADLPASHPLSYRYGRLMDIQPYENDILHEAHLPSPMSEARCRPTGATLDWDMP